MYACVCMHVNKDTYTKAVCPAATQELCASLYVALASHRHKWSWTMFHVVFPVFHLLSLMPLSSPSQHPSILFPFFFVFLLWPFLHLTFSLEKGCLHDKFKSPLLRGQNIIQKAWQKSRGKWRICHICFLLFSPCQFLISLKLHQSIHQFYVFSRPPWSPPNLTRRQLCQIERKLFAMQYNSPIHTYTPTPAVYWHGTGCALRQPQLRLYQWVCSLASHHTHAHLHPPTYIHIHT